MRKTKRLIILLTAIFVLVCLAFSFAACGSSEDPDPGMEQDNIVLTFTAQVKSARNAVVAVGDYAYAFELNLYDDKTLDLKCTAIGDKSLATVAGGGVNAGVSFDDLTDHVGSEEFAKYNIEYDGTWSEEEGWGYTVKLNDADKSEIKVDYDSLTGRHTFFYYIAPVVDEVQVSDTLIKFMAEDSSYRKKLASDYETYHVHESTYQFYAYAADGSRYNRREMYLMPDGSVANYYEEGSEESYDGLGTWSETQDHVITIVSGGITYVSNKYDPELGYRFPKAQSDNSGFISITDDYKSNQLTDYIFDGDVVDTINGTGAVIKQNGSDVEPAYADYTLQLTEKGTAKIVDASGSELASGTYTGEAGSYTVTIGGGTGTFADNALGLEVTVTTTTKRGPNITTTVKVYSFTFTDN